ncbi:MAG: Holliday junction resolvase RuvX [Hyphomicrobiales bacterium]
MAAPRELFDAHAFVAIAGDKGVLLGLDPGTKTIGVAISDVDRSLASPLTTIRRTKFSQDAATLADVIAREAVSGLVIGMPFNMDGTAGPRAQSVRAFRRSLAEHIDLPMLFWDERLSSEAAGDALRDAGKTNRQREAMIDAAAAAHILNECLSYLRGLTNQ